MRERNDIVVMTGVSGCGKDFLLNRALCAMPESCRPRLLPFGTVLFEKLRVNGGIGGGRDQLRSADPLRMQAAAREIVEEVSALPGATVINTHITYRVGDSLVVNPDMDRIIMPRQYVFVQADPGDIQEWRRHDMTRQRYQEDGDTIDLHQAIALGVVMAIAQTLRTGLVVINNSPHNVSENVTEIVGTLT